MLRRVCMFKKPHLFILAVIFSLLFSCTGPTGGGGEPSKENCDWLILMYMDGDNDLCQDIFENILEAEAGLYSQAKKNPDVNVKVVCLFDGMSRDAWLSVKRGNDASFTGGLRYKDIEGTYIWELGKTKDNLGYGFDLGNSNWENQSGLSFLARDTKNLTSTAGFLSSTYNAQKNCAEADMSDYATLRDFLIWASKRYNAKNRVVLISDHGSGVYSDSTRTEDSYSRSVCTDNTTNTNKEIYTNQLSLAFEGAQKAGFQKADIVMFDACYEACIEELYEIRKYTNYIIASPQRVAGFGFPYCFREDNSISLPDDVSTDEVFGGNTKCKCISFLSNISSKTTPESFGKEFTRCYANYYSIAKQNNTNSNLDFDGTKFNDTLTCTFVKTAELDTLVQCLSDFAECLFEKRDYQYVDSDGQTKTLNGFANLDKSNSYVFSRSDESKITDIKGWPSYYYLYQKDFSFIFPRSDIGLVNYADDPNNPKNTCLYYKGSYHYMVDIAYLMKMFMEENDTNDILKEKCRAVVMSLNNCVVSNWRRYPSNNMQFIDVTIDGESRKFNKGLYQGSAILNVSTCDEINGIIKNCYGITVSGASVENSMSEYIDLVGTSFARYYPRYYSWSEFGMFTKWFNLISKNQ